MQRLAIFKPGTHTSAGGQTLEFTEADVARAAEVYDPALHEAPIVVGHPRDNGPAYGWIKAMDYSDGHLHADADQLEPQFTEMVKAGRFKKRSASFYAPDAPANPVPGSFYLRHVGFLGAAAPAVKGLPDPQFSADEEGVIEFTDDHAVASIFRRLRDWFIGQHGMDTADSVIPGFLVEDMELDARMPSDNKDSAPEPGFTEPPTTPSEESAMQYTEEQIKALETENAALKQQQEQAHDFTERERALAEREAKATRAALSAEVDALVASGRLTPGAAPALVEFMAALPESDEHAIEFGEGDDAKRQTPREYMRAFLADLPKAIDYTERAPGDESASEATPQEVAGRARVYRERVRTEEGREITFTEATAAVRENRDQPKAAAPA